MGNLTDWLAEAARKLKEGSDYAKRERIDSGKTYVCNAVDGKNSADYGYNYIQHIAKAVHKGHKSVCIFIGVGHVEAKFTVALVKILFCLFLVVKYFNNLLPVYHLFNIAVHSGYGTLRAHKIPAGFTRNSAHKL